MKTNDEFEIISHAAINYKIFLVNMLYRCPHIHKDFEICCLLSGEISVISLNEKFLFRQGDLWIMNPFQSHELKAESPALVLALQVPPSFFSAYYPQIENMIFSLRDFAASDKPDTSVMFDLLIRTALCFFRMEPLYELKCAGFINLLFHELLERYPHTVLPEKERNAYRKKAGLIRALTDYVDTHYTRKLLLSEIARESHLSLSYLSHFFKDSFGISFQEYLLRIRCEKARQLLLLTNQTLLDISISCGFSDMKYFSRGFRKQYGYSPNEYRKNFNQKALPAQQDSMMTTQDFLSPATSLIVLEKHSARF